MSIASGERVGTQQFPSLEQGGVHRPDEGPRRRKPSKAQTGNEGDRFVMAMRDGGPQSLSALSASMLSSEIGESAAGFERPHQAG